MTVSNTGDFPAWLTSQVEATKSLDPVALTGFVQSWTRKSLLAAFCDEKDIPRMALSLYEARLWKLVCLHLEVRGNCRPGLPELEQLVRDLQAGHLHYGATQSNLIQDVFVAQGLELGENKAAEMFENDYMPSARSDAIQFLGQRGLEMLGNLSADLILPREDKPPKIATYRGKTPLKTWLKSVVVNTCLSKLRKQKREKRPEMLDPLSATPPVSVETDSRDCEKKLAPLITEAVQKVDVEERVLLKLLFLEGVQQKALARVWRIDPGNVTRRKQRAASNLLENIRSLSHYVKPQGLVKDCLEILLAGDSAPLRSRIALLMAQEIRGADSSGEEVR